MRRTLPALVAASLLLAACGDEDSEATEPTDEAGATTDAAPSGSEEEKEEESDDVDAAADTQEAADPASDYPEKPEVEVPDEAPNELVATTLIEGEGPEAKDGDTIVVDYVGVRTVDGVEFDASYNRRSPFPITLGAGAVIDGWEQGLQGVQAGERIQLDIPSELAYGEQAQSEIIRADEDLTFVIDVRKVISTDAVDPPTEAGVEPSEGVETTTWEDLVVGEGDTLEQGDTAVIHFALFRGDNLQLLDSSWETDPYSITMEPEALAIQGMYDGMLGMQVGGRRAIIIPPEEGFGPDGSPQMGLPADTDVVLVIDLLGIV